MMSGEEGSRKEALNKSREKHINIVLVETSSKYTIERGKIEKASPY